LEKTRQNSFNKSAGKIFEKEKLSFENMGIIVSEVGDTDKTIDKRKLWAQL
jgi:hypothetical protein